MAGFKTQQALSERIASLEGLDAVPRDAVSRAFREQAVELITLERIARALGVEVFELLMTAEEEGVSAPTADWPPSQQFRFRTSVALAIVVSAAVVWFIIARDIGTTAGPEPGTDIPSVTALVLDLRDPGILVPTFRGDAGGQLTAAIRGQLAERMRVASVSAEAVFRNPDPMVVLRRLGADLLLEGEVVTIGRMTAVRAYVQHEATRRQLWAEAVPSHRFESSSESIADNIAAAIDHLLGHAPSPGPFPDSTLQEDYLQGLAHLEAPFSELNLMRAQARFQAALRRDPGFIGAQAGLCRALVEIAWLADADRAMEDAASVCTSAMEAASEDSRIRVAYGHYLRAAGRTVESVDMFRAVLEGNNEDVDALVGLAYSAMLLFRETGDPATLSSAMDAARRGVSVDPGEWRAPFFLASMEFFSGDQSAALAAAHEAVSRDENEMTLTNFGTLAFCAGEVDRARAAYLRAAEIAPLSYVGNEFLGLVHFYLGDYQESARLRVRAIESVAGGEPEMHEMWGNLADSYRRSGDTENAVRAYRRAVEILEREFLRGGISKMEHAARAWYLTALESLDEQWQTSETLAVVEESLAELVDVDFDPASLVRTAKTWLVRGDMARARDALEQATTRCPVYAFNPDLVQLSTH